MKGWGSTYIHVKMVFCQKMSGKLATKLSSFLLYFLLLWPPPPPQLATPPQIQPRKQQFTVIVNSRNWKVSTHRTIAVCEVKQHDAFSLRRLRHCGDGQSRSKHRLRICIWKRGEHHVYLLSQASSLQLFSKGESCCKSENWQMRIVHCLKAFKWRSLPHLSELQTQFQAAGSVEEGTMWRRGHSSSPKSVLKLNFLMINWWGACRLTALEAYYVQY